MALELVKLDSGTLPAIADAIREKTGDTARLLPSQMAAAINGIQTGVTLPELTKPAADADVVKGKQYISADGEKKTGTLVAADGAECVDVTCDAGVGVRVEIEFPSDGSCTAIELPEPNILPDNIVVGASIFGISGTAKTLRVETGTITPAEDVTSLEFPCTANPKMIIVHLTDASLETVVQEDMVAVMRANLTGVPYELGTDGSAASVFVTNLQYHNTGGKRGAINVICTLDPVKIPGSSTYQWRAGLEYTWTAYYWEDDT
ncbi:MAG: hypothetical protein ACI3V2_08400 [Faecousia sp.]